MTRDDAAMLTRAVRDLPKHRVESRVGLDRQLVAVSRASVLALIKARLAEEGSRTR